MAFCSVVLYSAWFCPYAQRAWIALNENENKNNVPTKVVESLSIDPATEAYVKLPKLLEYNPKGLVPVLVETSSSRSGDGSRSGRKEEEAVYCDSLAILYELYSRQLKEDDGDAATRKARLEERFEKANYWNQRICSFFYTVIMCQDPLQSKAFWEELVDRLMEFCQHLPSEDDMSNGQTFYDMQSEPGIIDLTVFPFVHRLYLLEHYKGFTFPEATQVQRNAKRQLLAWQHHMEGRPSVAQTLASRDKLTPIYKRYADGSAKSKVAESVRQGRAAHDV